MIAGAFLVAIGVAIFIAALIAKKRAMRQFAWTRVSATIVSSAVGLTNVFHPDIEYEYVHKGRRFRGHQFRTLEVGWGLSSTSARRDVNRYPVGASVGIYIDPASPSNAVVEPGGDPKFLPFACGLAGLVFLAGLRFLVSTV